MRIAMALVVSLAACSSAPTTSRVSTDDAPKLLIDRNWMDRMPETDRDKLFVYRFVPSMGGGVFQDRTLFKGTFELFSFSATGNAITFDLHETKDKVTSTYWIERIDGPEPFDLKLTIPDDPRGPKVYLGIRGENDVTGGKLEQRLKSIDEHGAAAR